MKYKNWFIFIEIPFIIFFLVLEKVVSVDKQYEACVPKNCGKGPNISYPFWIDGDQESFCGSPGFGVFCNNNKEPTLKLAGDEYIIHDIGYQNQSLFISKAGLPYDICSPVSYKVNFNTLLFTYATASLNLSLFFNCTSLVSDEYSRYSIGCTTDAPSNRSLALFSEDPEFRNVNQSGKCGAHVVIHVDRIGNGSGDTYTSRDFVDEFLTKGFHLKWNATKCDECENSGGRCGFDFDNYKFMCFCSDRPHQRSCKEGRLGLKAIIGLISGGGTLAIITFLCCWVRKYSTNNCLIFWKRKNKAHRLVEDFLRIHGSLAPKQYNFSDIKKITNSFKDKIGQGGYGGVYKGKLSDGRLVAVKLLNMEKGNGEDFINEIASISRTSHVNVVSLIGFCFNGSKGALIYEFMENGSLEKFIYDQKPLAAQSLLTWETHYQIAVGVARGLEYLHRGCSTRILHFDIKPHNILLDKDFTPKISDFGLSKLCLRNESIISMLDARGTAGYIAPEVFNRRFGGVSHKSDVYSYGMMVLEIVGRRKNINVEVGHTSEIYFPSWIYKRIELDEDLGLCGIMSLEEKEITRKMILVALWCIQTSPMDRPTISKVVEMLEGRNELLSIPPRPYLCSPPRSLVASSHG